MFGSSQNVVYRFITKYIHGLDDMGCSYAAGVEDDENFDGEEGGVGNGVFVGWSVSLGSC